MQAGKDRRDGGAEDMEGTMLEATGRTQGGGVGREPGTNPGQNGLLVAGTLLLPISGCSLTQFIWEHPQGSCELS
jgi:hypothetical protein